MALAAAKSVRSLVSGSGTVTTTSGSKVLTFSSAQNFKEGAAIIADPSGGSPQAFTIDMGAATTWSAVQAAPASLTGASFTRTDESGNKGRGTSSPIVPDAIHYVYVSNVDDAGAADVYPYVDTVKPINAVHPYTRDPVISSFMASKAAAASPFMIARAAQRFQILEGILRYDITGGTSHGDASNPGKRLAAIESRLYALERYVNGQTGAPAVGSNGLSVTPAQALSVGDAAGG